ncbi:MAG: hypothetical protein AB7V08_12845 [Elusimicrobiales bacterium]
MKSLGPFSPDPDKVKRNSLLALLAFFVYCLFFWKKALLQGLIPADGNTLLMSYPVWQTGAGYFKQALLPLWDPLRNLGEPFLADPQAAILYPLTWLSFLGSWASYFKLWIPAHTLLAGISGYLLAASLYKDREAALTAGLLAAFNGLMIARSSLPNHFAALAWIPAAGYFLVSGRTVPLALCLAAQWFAGYPPFSLITFTALLLLLPLTEKPAESARRLAKACLIFIGLAAVQLLPFLEMLKESARGVLLARESALVYALGSAELLKKIFVPLWYGFFPQSAGDPAMVNFYFGFAPLAAALLILVKKREKPALYVLAALALAFSLCLGLANPVYAFPLFKAFRYPANWLALACLFAPLAAAAGFSAIQSRKVKIILAAVVAAELLVNAQFRQKLWVEPGFFTERPAILKTCPPGGIYHSPLLRESMEKGFQLGNAGDALLLRESAYPSYGAAFGFSELGSYQVLSSRRARLYAARIAAAGPGSALLDRAGIGAVITLRADPAGKALPEPAVILNPAAAPCVLEPRTGTAGILEARPGRLKIHAELSAPATLVLAQAWYPGWRLKIDGEKAEAGLFDGFLLSAGLGAGRHTLEFYYLPLSFLAGLLISALTAALLLLRRFRPRPGG